MSNTLSQLMTRLWWRVAGRGRAVSREFGLDRGRPIDRFYIERFLEGHRQDVRGRVLEVGDRAYTKRFGGAAVTASEVLHAEAGNEEATVVGDLVTGEGVPRDAYDCVILTQVLPFVFEPGKAVAHVHAALKPGGVVLATAAGISQISRYDMDRWGDYWRFTNLSFQRLFGDVFGEANVEVTTHGNVYAATAFLHGLAVEDVDAKKLEARDEDYQLVVTVRAQRGEG